MVRRSKPNNTKKDKRKIERKKQRAQMKEASEMNLDSLISPRVAINPRIQERIDTDKKKFVLIFDDYNNKECELCKINLAQARAVIKKFQDITNCESKHIVSSGLVRDHIERAGLYLPLFVGLSDDIDLKETELPNGGRVFYYVVSDFFCVVAIQAKHKNVKK